LRKQIRGKFVGMSLTTFEQMLVVKSLKARPVRFTGLKDKMTEELTLFNQMRPHVGMPPVVPSSSFTRSPKPIPWKKVKVRELLPQADEDPLTRELYLWLNRVVREPFSPREISLVSHLHTAIVHEQMFSPDKVIVEKRARLADMIAFMESKKLFENKGKDKEVSPETEPIKEETLKKQSQKQKKII